MKKIILLFLFLFVSVLTFAQDDDDEEKIWSRFQLHGFFSQGFMYTGDNDYLTMETKEGSFEWQEAALNLSGWLNERWRFGAQVFSRNMGELNNYRLELDWAYLDFLYRDEISFRLGKIKTPFGFYNDQQDIEFLHSWILLPQSIYPTYLRSLNLSHTGLDIYGTLTLSDTSEITYQAFAGKRYVDRNGGLFQDYSRNGFEIQEYNTDLMAGLDVKIALFQEKVILSSSFLFDDYVIQGIRNSNSGSGKGDGQGGGSGQGGGCGMGSGCTHSDGDGGDHGSQQHKGPGSMFTLETDNARTVFNAGIQINLESLTLTGEIQESREKYVNEDKIKLPIIDSRGWYVSASYMLSERVSIGTYFSSMIPNKQENMGQASQFQDDIATTIRWQMKDYLILKAEFHAINGHVMGVTSPMGSGTLKDKWNIWALKATFNF